MSGPDAPWDYEEGGANWINNPSWCSNRVRQSPILIDSQALCSFRQDKEVHFFYQKMSAPTYTETGKAMQIIRSPQKAGVFESRCFALVGSQKFIFTQAHFHTPAEHSVGRDPSVKDDLECHVVHTNPKTNENLVVAFRFTGKFDAPKSPFLDDLIRCERRGETSGTESEDSLILELSKLFEWNAVPMFYYTGSLTTPPCTENVEWYVAKTQRYVCLDQIKQAQAVVFAKHKKGNCRVLQNVGDVQYNKETVYSVKSFLHKNWTHKLLEEYFVEKGIGAQEVKDITEAHKHQSGESCAAC
eukprot:Selendium_serpulae@DN2570_c0_g1_i2.p1